MKNSEYQMEKVAQTEKNMTTTPDSNKPRSINSLNSEPTEKNQTQITQTKWSKKKKITLFTTLVLIITGIAIFCAVYFTMDHSRIDGKMVKRGSGQVGENEFTYEDYEINVTYQDNTQSKLKMTAMNQKTFNTRLLQETGIKETIEQTCYTVFSEEYDATFKYCNNQVDSDPSLFYYDVLYDGKQIVNDILSDDLGNERILQEGLDFEVDPDTGDVNIKEQRIQDIQSNLEAEGLQLMFNIFVMVDAENLKSEDVNEAYFSQKMEKLQNPENLQDEGDENLSNEDKQKRLRRRLGLVKKIFKKTVNVVKKAGHIIGAVVGGTIGAIVGGPAGLVAGAKLGYKIGSATQSFLNACLPVNSKRSLKLKCNAKKVGIEVLKGVAGYFSGKYLKSKYGIDARIVKVLKKKKWKRNLNIGPIQQQMF